MSFVNLILSLVSFAGVEVVADRQVGHDIDAVVFGDEHAVIHPEAVTVEHDRAGTSGRVVVFDLLDPCVDVGLHAVHFFRMCFPGGRLCFEEDAVVGEFIFVDVVAVVPELFCNVSIDAHSDGFVDKVGLSLIVYLSYISVVLRYYQHF